MATKVQQSEHVGYSIENFNNCENIPRGTNTAFFTYGRFQPGHKGHEKMIMSLLDIATKANATTDTTISPDKTNIYVFVSPSGSIGEKNPQKNPLSPNQKVDLLQQQYANLPIHFVNMGEAKAKQERAGPGGAAILLKKCYSNAVMLVGGDRIGAFDWMGNIMDIEFEHQTRQQTSTFENAIQFGAVTPEHAEEIKQMIIQAQPRTTGGKKKNEKKEKKNPPQMQNKTKYQKKNKKNKKRYLQISLIN